MPAAFGLLAFPRGGPSGLTKGYQFYWLAVVKLLHGVTVSSSSAEESQGADVPCGSGGTRDVGLWVPNLALIHPSIFSPRCIRTVPTESESGGLMPGEAAWQHPCMQGPQAGTLG